MFLRILRFIKIDRLIYNITDSKHTFLLHKYKLIDYTVDSRAKTHVSTPIIKFSKDIIKQENRPANWSF